MAARPTDRPAIEWDMEYTTGARTAQAARPCRSRRRSCTAGMWSPSRSTTRTAPRTPECGLRVRRQPGRWCRGSPSDRRDTGSCKHMPNRSGTQQQTHGKMDLFCSHWKPIQSQRIDLFYALLANSPLCTWCVLVLCEQNVFSGAWK